MAFYPYPRTKIAYQSVETKTKPEPNANPMYKNWQRWTFVGITLIGILSGSKLLALYEAKAPSPKVRKTITVARIKAETEKAAHDSVAAERRELANALIQAGLQRIGIPYVYGGTSEKGFD